MCRPLALILILLAVLLKDHASSVHGQQAPPAVPLAAQNFFNEAESSVESLAANAILNYKNREEYNARTCCEGSCSANLLSSDAGNKTSQSFFDKGGNIALVAVPGSVVLVVLILLCFCGRKMYAACHSCVVMWLTPPPVVSPTTVMWGSDWGKEVVGMRLSFPDNSRVGGTPSTATSTTSTTQLVSSPDPSTVGSPQVATTGSRRTKSSLQGEGKDSASNNRDPWTDSL
ncbi:hypothetical protein AXG93_1096s1000 [Marchantia polymorpha subsp. ruderalis]|uniref:Uncharacterized protein n=1 Tax=Marchantia polymorpha subsp. ruderalis TaxID=1480154 RepID=A0A176VES4_MARPO|nr:hypothetical protein AXG93_1096s1000 [Marchantia polymorpha subsp. ruderalis]